MKFFLFLLIIISVLCCAEKTTAQTPYVIQHSSTCAGVAVSFNSTVFETAQFPDTIKWNFGDAASGLLNTAKDIQQPTHIYNTPGSYIVSLHVHDFAAGTIDLTDTLVIVNPVVYNFGPDVFLCGDTGTYTLNAPVVPNAMYEWNDDTLTKSMVLVVNKTGAYTVKINGCPVTDTIGVFFTTIPNLDLGRDHVMCQGEQITLDASSENATYQWKLNSAVLPDTQSQLPVTAPGGQYIATIDVAGCGIYSDTVDITFSAYTAPVFSLGPDTLLCPKEIFSLTAHVPNAIGYAWSSKGLNVNDAVNYNIDMDSVITIRNPGRYWVFVNVGKQCEVVDTMIVRYRGNKQLNFNDTALCMGTTLVLDADFGTGIYKWESIPPQRDDQNNTNQSTYFIYKPGFYAVTATVGHCVFKDSLNVVFNDTLKLKLPKDTTLCRGEPFLIHPVANVPDYQWQDGSTGGLYSAVQTGLYRITAQNGCGRDTASMNIIFEDCPCALLLPNAFTPNGDGINDYFRPLHACDMQDYSMTIFNRYGEKIYFTKDPLQGWDGKAGNDKPMMGAYVWMVSYTRPSNKQLVQKQGTVLLMR
jgi:gliding motility-associated-like protein